MKITEIKSFLLTYPRDLHIIKIETDEGICGLGEAGCSTREWGQEGVLRHFREFLIGMDPLRIEHIWQILYRGAYFEGGRVITAVISAIDIALHDILGKALGVPVYQLLGGACRDRIPGFISIGDPSAPDAADQVRAAVEEGWPAIRLGIARRRRGPGETEAIVNENEPYNAYESIAATAEAFTELYHCTPKHIPLGLDFHHRLSVAEAARFCQMIPRGSMAFLEEPIRQETPDAYAALRRMTDVPFAIGEEWSSKWQALPYIERGLANFARIDLCCIGGFTEARKVAGWAEAHYIDVMPHNPIGPVCTAATVHFAAAVGNINWLEVNRRVNEAGSEVFPEIIRCVNGYYPLPTKPGLGVEFDEAAALKHPLKVHEHPHLLRPDGSFTNW